MTPTTRLDRVLGDLAELARHDEADDGDEDDRGPRRQRGQAEAVLGGTEADHDQHDLGALEEDALEGHGEADAVAPRARRRSVPSASSAPSSATVSA